MYLGNYAVSAVDDGNIHDEIVIGNGTANDNIFGKGTNTMLI